MKRVVAVNENGARIGESHQNAKYPNAKIDRVLDLRDLGIGYTLIGKVCGMPKSVVRDIIKGNRRCQFAVAYKTITCG